MVLPQELRQSAFKISFLVWRNRTDKWNTSTAGIVVSSLILLCLACIPLGIIGFPFSPLTIPFITVPVALNICWRLREGTRNARVVFDAQTEMIGIRSERWPASCSSWETIFGTYKSFSSAEFLDASSVDERGDENELYIKLKFVEKRETGPYCWDFKVIVKSKDFAFVRELSLKMTRAFLPIANKPIQIASINFQSAQLPSPVDPAKDQYEGQIEGYRCSSEARELPCGWERNETVDGRVYYSDSLNNYAQWEFPSEPPVRIPGFASKLSRKIHENALQLPGGWTVRVSPANGRVYYRDEINHVVQWDAPKTDSWRVERTKPAPAAEAS